MAAELMTLPPFERISDLWNRGQLIPFLGPGASVVGRSPHEGYSPAHPSSPPSAAELADLLASEVNFPSTDANLRTDLTLVSSYFEVMHGRGPLQNRIRELLDRDYDPAPLHKLIASFSIPQLIVVSTHDTLVEDAFRRIGKPFDVVTHSSDRREIAREVV